MVWKFLNCYFGIEKGYNTHLSHQLGLSSIVMKWYVK